ncbi:MAG: hypothetical protein EPN91_09075 [Salinibacterium sp.]|nr:MAG: hypothetical protein EPN91_09075 [Salinibacterium sp.]
MSKKDKAALVVGGEPRVSLLPPEINEKKQARLLRGRLISALFLVAAVTLAGIGGAAFFALQSQAMLDEGNNETNDILLQQAKYSDAGRVASAVELAKAARAVGSSTEIDLADYLGRVRDTLPAGAKIATVDLDSGSPLAPYSQATVPLQKSRIATFTFTVQTTSLPDVQVLLNSLVTLPGFTDASPTSVGSSKGVYETAIVMHVNSDALAYRFVDAKGIIR